MFFTLPCEKEQAKFAVLNGFYTFYSLGQTKNGKDVCCSQCTIPEFGGAEKAYRGQE
jgi:hypothetical protein